jgi:UDP-N-acetylmuramoylalanine--D-glutamate ligase
MKKIEGKKISIIGAAESGVGAARLIKKFGGIPFISDSAHSTKFDETVRIFKDEGINFEFDGHSERIYDCDFIVTSPGVPSNSEVLETAREKNIKIMSELEFSALFCKGKIISITGTNGKTTTTSLCAYVFEACGIKTYMAGNIRPAFSDVVLDVKEDECVALETSSFQLDYIYEFKPKIAAILNITPDHLDRYNNNLQNYIDSKLKVYINQDKNDYLILNFDDELTPKEISNKKVNLFYFSLYKEVKNGAYLSDKELIYKNNGKREFSCSINDLSLKGEHNYANAMTVIIMAMIFKLNDEKLISALKTFPGVEHRLEFVKDINGVKFINDSKATNVDSVRYALRSFDQPIFLILGGKDKGNDYNRIKDLVAQKVKKIYAIGSSSEKVYNFFHNIVKVEMKISLEDCVNAANKEAKQDEIVLLSPACASFDMFDNYEHRGKVFKEAVNSL